MPTENRSSNTEMVSVPREPTPNMLAVGLEADGLLHKWYAMVNAAPAPHPHAEPIAWMVGTAFWWTKEEAERDAAATGLPIVGLGPMTGAGPVMQQQGAPVALPERKRAPSDRATTWNSRIEGFNECLDEMSKLGPLYSRPVQAETVITVITAEQVLGAYQFASFEPAKHLRGTTNWCAAFAQELNYRIGADTGEVERIAKELRETREERDGLRRSVDEFQSRSHGIKNLAAIEQLNDKLADRDVLLQDLLDYDISANARRRIEEALSASAEPEAKS